MKKSSLISRLPIIFLILATTVFITFQVTYLSVTQSWKSRVSDMIKTDRTTISESISELDSVVSQNSVSKYDTATLVNGALNGYLSGTNDRFSQFLTPEMYKDYQIGSSHGTSTGIGISALWDSSVGGIYVVNCYSASPAQISGIVPGDVITHVNGKSVMESGFYGAMLQIGSGKADTSLSLTVRRPNGTTEMITPVRAVVKVTPISGTISQTNRKVGIIRIEQFSDTALSDFQGALEELISRGAERFIIDIRNNYGSNIESISRVLDFLLPEGVLMTSTNKDGATRAYKSDINAFMLPTVVLVNNNTIFGSELFAAAMRELGNAPIVGEKTYGKVQSQEIFPLPDKSAVSISTLTYTTSLGNNLDVVGVVPDFSVIKSSSTLGNLAIPAKEPDDAPLLRAIEAVLAIDSDATPNT